MMQVKKKYIWSTFLVFLTVICLLDGSKNTLYLFSGLSLILFFVRAPAWAAIYAIQVYYIAQLEAIEGGLFVAFLPILISLSFSFFKYRKSNSFNSIFFIFILMFFILLFAALSFSPEPGMSTSLTITTLVLSLNSIFLGFYFLKHQQDFKYFIFGLIIVGFILFAQGVLLSYGNAGRFSVRAIIGTGGVSYFAASLILMVLGSYLIESRFGSLGLFHIAGVLKHKGFYFVLAIAMLGILLSISRSSMVVLFFVIVFLVFYEYRGRYSVWVKKIIIFSPFLLLALFLVFFFGLNYINILTGGRFERDIASVASGTDASFSIRLQIWSEVLQTNNLTTWLFGNGLGSFRLVNGRHYEHSVFIAILFSGGIILSVLFASVFILMLVKAKETRVLYLIFSFFIALTFFAHSNLLDMQFWLSVTLLIVLAFSRNDKKIMSGV